MKITEMFEKTSDGKGFVIKAKLLPEFIEFAERVSRFEERLTRLEEKEEARDKAYSEAIKDLGKSLR